MEIICCVVDGTPLPIIHIHNGDGTFQNYPAGVYCLAKIRFGIWISLIVDVFCKIRFVFVTCWAFLFFFWANMGIENGLSSIIRNICGEKQVILYNRISSYKTNGCTTCSSSNLPCVHWVARKLRCSGLLRGEGR